MVTASHNPKVPPLAAGTFLRCTAPTRERMPALTLWRPGWQEDNGYKVYWENGAQIISPHDTGAS